MSASAPVSVVIPTYNCAPYLAEALESVFSQTALIHEVIVVDDGSTDRTREALAPFRGRIVLVEQANAGVSRARNVGIELASGEWVAFLDADDVWRPEKTARQLARLAREPDCVCVHTGFVNLGESRAAPPRGETRLEWFRDVYSWVKMSSAIVRRSARARFKEWCRKTQDGLYFTDLSYEGPFAYVDEPLVGYRVGRPGSSGRLPGAETHGLDCQMRWLRELDRSDREELTRAYLARILDAMQTAKWLRRWSPYSTWRTWLERNWPDGLSRPRALEERIYPRIVYRVKDAIDRIRRPERGGAKAHVA